MKSEEVISLVWSLVFNSLISLSHCLLSLLSQFVSLLKVMHWVFQFSIETKSITVSVNDSSSSLMNDSALESFNESVSEIWEKRLRNSLKRSLINERFDMMKFEERTRLSEWWCLTVLMKMYDQVFNLQERMLLIRKIFLIYEFFEWFSSNSRRFFIVDSLNWIKQLIFTHLFHKNELILLIKWTLRT